MLSASAADDLLEKLSPYASSTTSDLSSILASGSPLSDIVKSCRQALPTAPAEAVVDIIKTAAELYPHHTAENRSVDASTTSQHFVFTESLEELRKCLVADSEGRRED